ncbi:MAG: hypothetical protein A3G39_11270 [Deltaproteobacteria bacterium RIFCSPLOWO2_12_FULL_43_16]|nr:MAG: hypothetical protein A3D30_08440 [Deltaproteobacteria bacterium RIFCSPHIGHO2_02_FULL_43_33]OGQ58249.1 MAG: hypothetical protein A3G39_11270 [Deltaproteobacteria bacterium RIFCSPLOWO2_12_FULL_43_16]HBR17180.1 hypothetical protein [Deltaproteobacteria bacterium]
MGIFIVIGIFTFVIGLLFIVSPNTLRNVNEVSSKMVTDMEEKAFTYRLGVGISLMIASLLFFFVAYYIRLRGGM